MRLARAVSAAVALAIASTVCRALPVEPYRRNFSPLEFVRHALLHENAWKLVLREKLSKLPAVPYEKRFPDAAALILRDRRPGDAVYSVRPILTGVLDEYADIGSYVDYAADVLLRCVKCFVTKHLLVQSQFVIRMFIKGMNPDTIMMELNSIKDNIVVSLDKMAVVPSDLGAMFHLYWEVARLMQYDVMHRMRFTKYPPNSQKKLNVLYEQFNEYLTENCTALVMDDQFFENINIPVPNMLILDKVLYVTVSDEKFMKLGRDHASFLARYLRNLGFDSMPQKLWGQIFYHSEKMPVKDELEETNVQIAPVSPKSVKTTTTDAT